MGHAKWSEELSVNVPTIDADHKKLFILLNDLFAACFAGVGNEVVHETLQALTDYSQYHFSREESLLQELGCPDIEKQIHEHRYFIGQLGDIARQGTATNGEEVVLFLKDWLLHHILEVDKLAFASRK
ncbi:MAG: hemerythrin family protein [Magnetococcales bacterium]|nr:hemerythrin family protein [Magnetococcales bacterium]MBF0323277.1 hemerythrin family protein [Magnetococcales bacterium]